MKYKIIKHNKTNTRQLALCGTLAEARAVLADKGATYAGVSYVGQFPTYRDAAGKLYSLQGQDDRFGIVCSLPNEEVRACAMPLPVHLRA